MREESATLPVQAMPADGGVDNLDRIVEASIDDYGKYINDSMARLYRFLGLNTVEAGGKGAIAWDIYGEEYIDCHGCNGVFFHGRQHPRVVNAVKAQLEKMAISSRILPVREPAELGKLIASISPGNLQYTFFGNSGAEAVEGAIKLAKLYTGRAKVVATNNGFHGKTMGALSATGRDLYKDPFKPLMGDFTHIPFGDSEAASEAIDGNTAAVIVEPVQGEGGVNIPPDDFLPRLRELCDAQGALLIFDEVQTGLGRTGRMFGSEHWGVVPDIMTMAKILGGGVMPIGAFHAKPEIWRVLDQNPYLHSSTFGGNPLATVAARAAIETIIDEGLVQLAQEKGEYLLSQLREIQGEHPEIIKEARGLGLMTGLEMREDGLGGMMIKALIDRKVLAVHSLNNEKVIRILPPATISYELMDRVIGIVREAVSETAGLKASYDI